MKKYTRFLNPVKVFSIMTLILGFTLSTPVAAKKTSTTKTPFIHYTEKGRGRPLILIHAWPADQRLWKPQQDELQQNFRVITLDLWGFGQSTGKNNTVYTMNEYADEVKQLMDQLHLKKAIIGGESMGGYVTLAFLKKYPQSVEAIILSDTQAIADSADMRTSKEGQAKDILKNGSSSYIPKFMPLALSPDASPETVAYLEGIFKEQSAHGMSASLLGIAHRDDNTDVLSKTNLPVLIITGDRDTLILPEQSQNMHELAKNSRLVEINNAGHLSSLEKPQVWNQAVLDMFGN